MPLPDVITALANLAKANVASGVNVFDQEPTQNQPRGDTYIAIGTDMEPGQMSDQDFGRLAQWDTYDIIGYVRSSSGNTTYAQDRNNAWTAWTAFRLAVQRTPNLGGALTPSGWIRPSEASYTQMTEEDVENGDADGVYAQVDFRFTVTDLVRP